MATKAERYEGIDGLKAYAIIGIALIFNIITSTRKLAVGSGTVPIYA